MWKHYFKTAWRSLRNHATYSFINIAGLGVSLAVSILLLLWVNDELSFDKFNVHAAHIYKLAPKFDDAHIWSKTPAPIAVYAKTEIPEVENACRIRDNGGVSIFEYNGKKFTEPRSCVADASFFSIFTYPLIKGSAQQSFTDAQSIILSETTAAVFFGNEDPMGKVIKADDKKLYRVTGIMKDMPANSSLQYNIIFNFQLLEQQYDTTGNFKTLNTNWDQYGYDTYVLLKPNANAAVAAQKMADLHRRNYNIQANKHLAYLLDPLTATHLYAIDGSEQGMKVVRVFFMIAVIVLLIACINYVNLITARAIKRGKEISLRKIVGANKAELFIQFLTESFLTFLISLIVATAIIYLVMPLYNTVSGKNMVFEPWSGNVLAVYGIAMLATMLLAGIYPAVTLSSFKPLAAMKGRVNGVGSKGNLRKGLVVVQFGFSILLITSTLVIGKQLRFIRQKNLGYDKENVFSFSMRNIDKHYDATVATLQQQAGILGVTASGADIISNSSGSSDIEWDGKRPDQQSFAVTEMPVEGNFIKVMGIQLLEGNGFTGSPSDSARFILNETAVKAAGIQVPVIGKRLRFQGVNGVIAGVVKDFHFQDMHQKIPPLLMQYNKNRRGTMYIRTTAKDAPQALAAAEKLWKKYNADYTFNYSFLDSQFDNLYKTDRHVGQLFNCFAIIAIVISCLGLFGLVIFTAESKVKEIGVRKVLGAGVPDIVMLLSKEFLILVLVAAVIAFPVAWYGLHHFLQAYAYRTDISWWVFALAGIVTLFIAMLTVGLKCVKAALANPVVSLKNE